MNKLFIFLLAILAASCKEKYTLPVTSPETGYLVVEGFINIGPGGTFIGLSRTNKLNSTDKRYEPGAMVTVEGNDNSTYSLAETSLGGYTAVLNLNSNRQYRLRIKTTAGKIYLSDFVAVKTTPPIDSIPWKREPDGIQLNLNTHDPLNKTRYYQWDYDEAWEIHSPFLSSLKFVNQPGPMGTNIAAIEYKDPITHGFDTTIFKCWQFSSSNQILIGSSAKLSQDVIVKPLLLIPNNDRKISVLYSIRLRQHALSKEGYEFLEKMKKNTEENGSIFDPQPSQLKGNIYCTTDANEPVIGFINVATLEEKRIFISTYDVVYWNYRSDCMLASIPNAPDSIKQAWEAGNVPTTPLQSFGPFIITFGATTLNCIDCTLSGTNIKPSFWP